MQNSLAPLKHTIDLNTRLFLNCLDGLGEGDARTRLTDSTNHVAFVVLHLVDMRHYLARAMGLDRVSPFEALTKDARRLEDIEEYPSLDALRAAWTDVAETVSQLVERLSGDELSKPGPGEFPLEGGSTLVGAIAFLVQHESYHIGQLAFLRRCLGYPAMSYR